MGPFAASAVLSADEPGRSSGGACRPHTGGFGAAMTNFLDWCARTVCCQLMVAAGVAAANGSLIARPAWYWLLRAGPFSISATCCDPPAGPGARQPAGGVASESGVLAPIELEAGWLAAGGKASRQRPRDLARPPSGRPERRNPVSPLRNGRGRRKSETAPSRARQPGGRTARGALGRRGAPAGADLRLSPCGCLPRRPKPAGLLDEPREGRNWQPPGRAGIP